MPSGYALSLSGSDVDFINSLSGYKVNKLGQVYSTYYEKFLEHEIIDGIPCIKTSMLNTVFVDCSKKGYIPVSVLVALAFKPIYLPLTYTTLCSIIYKDGNPLNLHPKNLTWKLPVTGLPYIQSGEFFYIPGFTRYAISRNGDVLNIQSGFIKRNVKISDEVCCAYKVKRDSNDVFLPVNIYRLLALTFLDYPANAEFMVVNHIDGDRSNSNIDNLEWVTHSENNLHAVMLNKLGCIPPRFTYIEKEFDLERTEEFFKSKGLINDLTSEKVDRLFNRRLLRESLDKTKKIKRLDIETKEIVIFDSKNDAIRESGLIRNQIYQSLESVRGTKSLGIVNAKYIFRYLDDDFPEITSENLLKYFKYGGRPRVTLLLDKDTGIVTEFASAAELCRRLNLNRKLVTKRLGLGGVQYTGVRNWYVQYKDSFQPWELK